MRIEVIFFAAARELAGTDRGSFDLGVPTVAELARAIAERHPALVPLMPRLRIAVNRAFVSAGHTLAQGDEVALIPPVAGGSSRFALKDGPLDAAEVVGEVASRERGAVVSFVGTVRDQSHGKKVVRLEYEAYREMALSRLEAIAAEAAQAHPGAKVAIHHRLGVIPVGEAAVVIAAAAPHRAEAFRACELAIERLKEDVPIWKKEIFEDGAHWVG